MDSTIEAAKKTVEQAKATVDEGISATAHGLSHGAAVAGSLLAQASDGLRSVLDQGQVRKRESHSTRVWVRAHLEQEALIYALRLRISGCDARCRSMQTTACTSTVKPRAWCWQLWQVRASSLMLCMQQEHIALHVQGARKW